MKSKPIPKQLKNIGGLNHAPVKEHTPGVYFLIRNEAVVYVGQSITPRSRIATHVQEGVKIFDDAWIRHCEASQLDAIESLFIHQLSPEYNFTMGAMGKLAPHSSDWVERFLASANTCDKNIQIKPTKIKTLDVPALVTLQQQDTPNHTRRLLRLPEVMNLVGLKKSTIYEYVKDKKFPAPVKIGHRAVAWCSFEITNWSLERMAAPAGIEPASTP